MLRGKDVNELEQMKGMGLSVTAISELTGYDRKTVRKYLLEPEVVPAYGPRKAAASKLDEYKPYLEERLSKGVWNAQVLLREIRGFGYTGGYTILRTGCSRSGRRHAWWQCGGSKRHRASRRKPIGGTWVSSTRVEDRIASGCSR